jgi:tetratricopeptide (TPR) repeat protein
MNFFVRKVIQLSFFFVFLFSGLVLAQKQSKDTLLFKEIKSYADSAQNNLFENPKLAVRLATKARDLAIKGNFKSEVGDMYNTIGNAYHLQANYKEAAYNYSQALKVFEELKSIRGQVATFVNLGILHVDQNDKEGAKKYYTKAIENAIAIGDSNNLASSYNNLAIVFQNENQPDTALVLYKKALEIRKKQYKIKAVCNSLINISTIYFDKKEYEKCLEQLLTVYHSDSTYSKDLLFKNLSDVYVKLKNFKEAEYFGLKAQAVAHETQNNRLLFDIYKTLYAVYQGLNIPQKAYSYADSAFTLKDELSSEENKRIISEMDAKYETEKKEQQIALQESRLAREKQLRYSMVVIIVLFIAFVVFLYSAYRNKKKTNLLLAEQKAMIEEQKLIVEEKQKALLDSIHYAKRIQQAMLPTESFIERVLNKTKKGT